MTSESSMVRRRCALILMGAPALVLLAARPWAAGGDGARAVAQVAAVLPAKDVAPPACTPGLESLATARYVRGASFANEAAVLAFRPAPEPEEPTTLALVRDVGAVYGLAFDPGRGVLYAAAFHKRNSAFGPLGPGGLYIIDLAGGRARRFARVPSAGNDLHHRDDDYQPDERGRSYAGKTSLGDIELVEGGSALLAVNLADRHVYRLSLPDGAVQGSFAHGAASEPWAADARPFALGVRDGWVFHGVTRTAYNSQDDGELRAHVYASRPDGTQMRQVAVVDLAYDRGRHSRWQPWPRRDDDAWDVTEHPQPILTDIAFDARGGMILGFRDRFIDTGPSLTEMYRIAPGDVLRLAPSGDMQWSLVATAPEYYAQDNLQGWHDEIAIGGLAVLPDRDVVVTTAIDPLRTFAEGARLVGSISAGALWLDNETGADVGRRELMFNSLRHAGPFGKANGLGDIEVLCVAATPTPTVTATPTSSPTPTASPTATKQPSPTATALPTATPTVPPRKQSIYLPGAARGPLCRPELRHASVVLVLDRSTSMMRPSASGTLPKNEAALQAARAFISLLRLDRDPNGRNDQVAIVGFNDTAWTEQPLTDDRAAALIALEALGRKTAEGTRLDLAIDEGQRALDGPSRRSENVPVMVLLTDGLPNRVPTPAAGGTQEDTVVTAATAAKARGTRLFTVGLGETEDVLRPLLERVASTPDMYYHAPTGDDLEAIYRQIAGTILLCP